MLSNLSKVFFLVPAIRVKTPTFSIHICMNFSKSSGIIRAEPSVEVRGASLELGKSSGLRKNSELRRGFGLGNSSGVRNAEH